MNQLSRTKQIIMDWFTIQVHTNFVPKTKGVATIMEQEAFDELAELERLAEIGRATEKLFEHEGFVSVDVLADPSDDESCITANLLSKEDLIDWAKVTK